MKEILKLFLELKEEFKYFLIDKITRLFMVRKYLSKNPIKLNLGSGQHLKKNFINIDLSKYADLRLDLRKILPFKKNSVDYIYNEHFFEHLSYTDTTAIRCLYDYLRILKKKAKLRIVIPDMEMAFKAYINKDLKFFKIINIEEKIPQSKKYASIIDYINYGIYQHGEHKYCYDFEKISLLLKSVGFKNIVKDNFNPKEDTEVRKNFSMYIECEK